MSNVILIQARLSSLRYPKKMLETLGDITLLEYVYQRCKQSKAASQVIVVTSSEETDDELFMLCHEKKMSVFRGSLNDVLNRYIECAIHVNASIVCRVCGDSPFVDIGAIDRSFELFNSDKTLEYVSTENCLNGFMSETMHINILKKIYEIPLSNEEKEHVTKYIRDNRESFITKFLDLGICPEQFKSHPLTIDYEDDLKFANMIIKHLKNTTFNSSDIIEILNTLEG